MSKSNRLYENEASTNMTEDSVMQLTGAFSYRDS